MRVENNRLRKLLSDKVPLGNDSTPSAAALVVLTEHLAVIRKWVAMVEKGLTGFENGPGGWVVSRRMRVNMLAVPREVVDALLHACGRIVDTDRTDKE